MTDPKDRKNDETDPTGKSPGDATATGDRRATPREGDGDNTPTSQSHATEPLPDTITERIPIRLSPRIAAAGVEGAAATARSQPANASENYRPHVTSGEINLLDLHSTMQQLVNENRDQHAKVDTALGELRSDLRERDARIEKRLDAVEANYTQLRSEFDIRKGRLAVWWLLISTSGIAIVKFLWPKAGDFLTRLFHGQASH